MSFYKTIRSALLWPALTIVILLALTTGVLSDDASGRQGVSPRNPVNDDDVRVVTGRSIAASPFSEAGPTLTTTQTVYIPGQTYWGRNQYIEYVAGDLPIIISAPHGGYLKPDEIPNRTWGSTGLDYMSQEYTREVAGHIRQITGGQPHLIINRLHRIKLDANRGLSEAAQGNVWAEQAWSEFHDFIDAAKTTVTTQCGQGLYLDFHTNDHEGAWVELGLGLTKDNLKLADATLDTSKYIDKSNIKHLATTSGAGFPELVRGPTSLGGLLQTGGYKSVPSPAHPDPGANSYFYTGYNADRHGSKKGGAIDSIQVETYHQFLDDDARPAYSQALAEAIVTILESHYGFNLKIEPMTLSPCHDLNFHLFLPLILVD